MRKTRKFSEGGFSTKEGENKAIGDDVRARAMAAIAAGGQKDEPKAKAKAPAKKATPKLVKPDYSNEDLDRMGLNEPDAVPVATSEENARESQALFNKKPVDTVSKADPEKVRKAYVESAKYVSRAKGMKSGGSVKSASARADGCAIRGKTRA